MATYIPNATQTTEPVESRTVESAALEFRTLKTSINARVEDVQDDLDAEIVNRIAGDANLQTQNNNQDVRIQAIEAALLAIGEGGLPGTIYVQRLSGTGAQTAFTLNVSVPTSALIDVFINGVYQNKDTFTIVDDVLTFSEAPPAGTDNVEVVASITIANVETDASLVSYRATDSSTTVRTVESKLREFVSVKDFGAVGDGVEIDQDAIIKAVTAAYETGASLDWPPGTYVSTANIPNIHAVIHTGEGFIKRGSDTFAVNVSDQERNIIYISPTGVEDGLSASTPANIDAAFQYLRNYGPILKGRWRIQLAAGTYSRLVEQFSRLSSLEYLEIFGPALNTPDTEPSAVVDAAGAGWGFYFSTAAIDVWVKDIKIVNATGSSVASGIICDNIGICFVDNVWTDTTQWAGVNANNCKRLIVYGGSYKNSMYYGLRAYGGTLISVGLADRRPLLDGCNAGLIVQGGAYGHCDYVDFANCSFGIVTEFNSHSTSYETTFTNVSVCHQAGINCSISRRDTIEVGVTQLDRGRGGGYFTSDVGTPKAYFRQHYPDLGVNGRSSDGYGEWVTPVATHQYSNGTTAGFNLSGFGPATALWESNGNTILGIAAKNPNYSGIWFGDEIVANGAEIRHAGGLLDFRFSGVNTFRFRSSDLAPLVDNGISLGRSDFRWTQVYAATGSINTSDEREKQQIRPLSEVEHAVAVRLKSLVRAFKFNDAVKAKGDGARIHIGVLAQDVKAAFEAEGLVAENYALLCYDEWCETPEERDEEGNVVQEYRPAGSRYGVRYEELMAFIIGAL